MDGFANRTSAKNRMIEVSFIEFVKSGSLGHVRLGLSLEEVNSLWGAPDHITKASTSKRASTISKYGDVETHFDATQRCYMIFLDYESSKDQFSFPSQLVATNWPIACGATRSRVMSLLHTCNLITEQVEYSNGFRIPLTGIVFSFDDSNSISSISIY